MGADIRLESNIGKYYPLRRLLIPLYMELDHFCSENDARLQLIEPFFEYQARTILGSIVNAYYYGPEIDYSDQDFERYQRDLSSLGMVQLTEQQFLERLEQIRHLWFDIHHYISVIKRLIPAIDLLHSLGQDPIGGHGPSVLKELLENLELAASEGAKQIRIEFS
jgi:hypothetical protein